MQSTSHQVEKLSEPAGLDAGQHNSISPNHDSLDPIRLTNTEGYNSGKAFAFTSAYEVSEPTNGHKRRFQIDLLQKNRSGMETKLQLSAGKDSKVGGLSLSESNSFLPQLNNDRKAESCGNDRD